MVLKKNKLEIRTTACKPVVRDRTAGCGAGAEARALPAHTESERRQGKGNDDGRTIEGVAIVFGPEYRVEDEFGDTYVERIAPSAVTAEWLRTQDVKLNLLHERDATIARCDKGEGSLTMEVKKDGVHFSFEAPECDLGDRALALVRAGVYSGCSFEFYPGEFTVEEEKDKNGRTVTVVTHTAFERLDALTIAMDPAYTETSVSARELREHGEKARAMPARTGREAVAGKCGRAEGTVTEAHDRAMLEERWKAEKDRRMRAIRMRKNRDCPDSGTTGESQRP